MLWKTKLIGCLALVLLTWTISRAGMMSAPTLRDLIRANSHIVIGQVLSKEARSESVVVTDNGLRSNLVFTYYEISVTESIKGESTETYIVRTLGGKLEEFSVVYDGMPNLSVGEKVVLFLTPSDRPGRTEAEVAYNLRHHHFAKFQVDLVDGHEMVNLPTSKSVLGIEDESASSKQIRLRSLKDRISSHLPTE